VVWLTSLQVLDIYDPPARLVDSVAGKMCTDVDMIHVICPCSHLNINGMRRKYKTTEIQQLDNLSHRRFGLTFNYRFRATLVMAGRCWLMLRFYSGVSFISSSHPQMFRHCASANNGIGELVRRTAIHFNNSK
jgi:hypothetical protein